MLPLFRLAASVLPLFEAAAAALRILGLAASPGLRGVEHRIQRLEGPGRRIQPVGAPGPRPQQRDSAAEPRQADVLNVDGDLGPLHAGEGVAVAGIDP